MFEDSTFESMGRIRTRSRGWMVAALALNSSILLAIVVIPLVYPEALPLRPDPYLIAVPSAPTLTPEAVQHQAAHESSGSSLTMPTPVMMPTQISRADIVSTGHEPVGPVTIGGPTSGSDVIGGFGDTFQPQPAHQVIHLEPKAPVFVPSSVAAGLLIYKPIPQYPALARTMRMEGTVVLEATISKAGTIANLRVVSGPAVLQQAAKDAVSTWRYQPYMLNGQPIDVETTINVIYTMGR
jgi:protein TonB